LRHVREVGRTLVDVRRVVLVVVLRFNIVLIRLVVKVVKVTRSRVLVAQHSDMLSDKARHKTTAVGAGVLVVAILNLEPSMNALGMELMSTTQLASVVASDIISTDAADRQLLRRSRGGRGGGRRHLVVRLGKFAKEFAHPLHQEKYFNFLEGTKGSIAPLSLRKGVDGGNFPHKKMCVCASSCM
jgi:hypothetical protein